MWNKRNEKKLCDWCTSICNSGTWLTVAYKGIDWTENSLSLSLSVECLQQKMDIRDKHGWWRYCPNELRLTRWPAQNTSGFSFSTACTTTALYHYTLLYTSRCAQSIQLPECPQQIGNSANPLGYKLRRSQRNIQSCAS